MLEQFRLDNKIAVVTGGTGALGAAMCDALTAAGATVIVLARRVESVTDGRAFACDVLDKPALEDVAERITAQFGRVDILVNAAGGNHPDATATPDQRTFFDLPAEALRWVFDLNLMGTVLPSQVFGAGMAQRGTGVIINISSMSAFRPLTRVVAYGAAKAAVNHFTQWLAVDMATRHHPAIRVNAIAPGFFLSDQNRFLLTQEDGTLTPRGESIISHTPMNRFGQPDDLAGALVWLASDASRFVTGIVVPVDGGFSAFSGV